MTDPPKLSDEEARQARYSRETQNAAYLGGAYAYLESVRLAPRLAAHCKTYGVALVVSQQAARHARVDLSSFDLHEAPVRGREEPVAAYAVPDPSAIRELTAELIDVDTRRGRISDNPIV